MQKITPFLWFNGRTEEAMNFYTSVFKNSKIIQLNSVDTPDGKMATGTFELDGQVFMALDGGPMFNFTPAVSFFVNCETQEEIDYYWDALLQGGREDQCGWLQDKFGLSWQIVPSILGSLLNDQDRKKANNAMQAMLQMKKLDIARLQEAHAKE